MAYQCNTEEHTYFMHQALEQAHKAYQADEVPVGAIIVDQKGTVLARAYNQVESQNTQCAHAELLALAQAGQQLGDWRLLDCWLFVTLQPCSMCMHAIRLHRLAGVVYGADSPLFGYHLDKKEFDSVYKDDTIQIVSGIEGEKSEQLLKQFFKEKREEHG